MNAITALVAMFAAAVSAVVPASPTPSASPSAPVLFDRTLPNLTATPCPGEPNYMQRVDYPSHIPISDKSRSDFVRDIGGHYGVAYLFTYLDGSSIVLVRNEARFDPELRELLHTFGEALRGSPVLPGCEHIGGVFVMLFDVSTNEIRLIPVTSTQSIFSNLI